MQKEPFIFCGAVKGVLTLLEGQPWELPRNQLLKHSGISEAELNVADNQVPLQGFAMILEKAAKLTGEPSLVFDLAERFEEYATTLTHYTLIKSPTVRQALEVAVRYAALVITFRSIELEDAGNTVYFRWSYMKAFGGMQQFPAWIPARLIFSLRGALGRDWKPEEVSFEHGVPEDLFRYSNLFGDKLLFNQKDNYIRLKQEDLECSMPGNEENLWEFLVELAERILAEREQKPAIVNTVQKLIVDALPGDSANIKHIAAQLGRSPRTLQRELNSLGSSFSSILEETRRELASKYLLDTDLHISQIAFLLGFSEVSVFSRAVNRWFGLSPSQYRQNHNDNEKQG